MRIPQSAFFIILTLVGIFVTDFQGGYQVFIKIFLVFSLWQYTVAVNRIYDEKVRGRPDLIITLSFLIISAALSCVLGPVFIVLSALFIIAGTVYSAPPLRLRRYLFSTAFIGLGSVIAFLIGYFGDLTSRMTYDVAFYCVLIFAAATLGSNIKDMKDYEKDRRSGIRNVFTIFGLEKGKRISYFLLFLTFILPSLIFNLPIDIAFFAGTAFLALLIFRRYEDFRPVMTLSFLVLLYCSLRLKGLL